MEPQTFAPPSAKPPHEALREVLSAVRGQPVVVLITGHPDPDAIGSALAYQRIAGDLGVPVTVAHVLPIAHRENRALVKLLHLDLLTVSTVEDLKPFRWLSLVDTTMVEPSIDLPPSLGLLTVVDHHRSLKLPEAAFVDVRPDIGSTSSIFAEYLEAGLSPLTPERRDDGRLASALLFGLRTDSDEFALATPADFRAAAYLRGHAEADILARLGHRVLGASQMDVLGRALANLAVVRNFALSGVGRIPPEERDSIATAADFILRREDIDTVVVFGLVGDQIDGSLRTNSPSVDPALFLRGAFGANSEGRPYGGGRSDKGAFQVPLGILGETANTDALWPLARSAVEACLGRVVPDLVKSLRVSTG